MRLARGSTSGGNRERQHEQHWHQLSAEVMSGMADWRRQHPTATWRDIEIELDGRLAPMRARMLEDLALESAAPDGTSSPASPPPPCPQCGTP